MHSVIVIYSFVKSVLPSYGLENMLEQFTIAIPKDLIPIVANARMITLTRGIIIAKGDNSCTETITDITNKKYLAYCTVK